MIKRILSLITILAVAASCSKKSAAPAPGVATLATPLKDQPCLTGIVASATESSVAFSWNASTNTDKYDLTVTNLLTQTAVSQTVSTTSATVKLLRNTPYSWYVTSKSTKSATVAKSDTWKFYNAGAGIVSYAPFPAEITAPLFGAVLPTGTSKVNLTWKGSSVSSNIVAYNVYFGPSNNPDLFRTQITDSFANDVAVGAGTTYYWHVTTIDANGNISDSGIYNFYVQK